MSLLLSMNFLVMSLFDIFIPRKCNRRYHSESDRPRSWDFNLGVFQFAHGLGQFQVSSSSCLLKPAFKLNVEQAEGCLLLQVLDSCSLTSNCDCLKQIWLVWD